MKLEGAGDGMKAKRRFKRKHQQVVTKEQWLKGDPKVLSGKEESAAKTLARKTRREQVTG